MSDVDPQRDQESNCKRRGWQLVLVSPAMIIRLARHVRSPARAELPHYRQDTQLQQMPYNRIIYKDYTDIAFG